jgi:hypothetical protein
VRAGSRSTAGTNCIALVLEESYHFLRGGGATQTITEDVYDILTGFQSSVPNGGGPMHRDGVHRRVVEEVPLADETGGIPAGERIVEFTLPADAVPSAEKWTTWRIVVEADIPRARDIDSSADVIEGVVELTAVKDLEYVLGSVVFGRVHEGNMKGDMKGDKDGVFRARDGAGVLERARTKGLLQGFRAKFAAGETPRFPFSIEIPKNTGPTVHGQVGAQRWFAIARFRHAAGPAWYWREITMTSLPSD